MTDLVSFLCAEPYPGRGIVVGRDRVYYFLTGRSVNSRNRVLRLTEDGARTQAHDPALLKDPSLVIYHPVRRTEQGLIVANGDQSDTIRDVGDFRAALMTRCYEPDAPHYTPRISALLYPNGRFDLSILRREAGRCLRCFYSYEGCDEGQGYYLSTYRGVGDPLPSFTGEPIPVTVPEPEAVWAALNEDNRVALYASVHGQERLFNKLLGD